MKPYCPNWNDDNWLAFSANIVLVEWIEKEVPEYPDVRSSISGTGRLLQHCFPEEWDEFYKARRERRGY